MTTILEISSSPEPTLAPFNKPFPKLSGTHQLATGSVFEFIDSDDDDPLFTAFPRTRKGQSTSAGPWRHESSPRPHIQTGVPRFPKSISNPLVPAAGATADTPLVLLNDDEEKEPTKHGSSPVSTVKGRSTAKPAAVIDLLEDDIQISADLVPFVHSEPEPTRGPEPNHAPPPEPGIDPAACVLDIIPDVEPVHVYTLIEKHSVQHQGNVLVERILHELFEDPTYPRVDRKSKGKRKRSDDDDADGGSNPLKRAKIDYADESRPFSGGADYGDLALQHLQQDFPNVPVAYLRTAMTAHKSLYAPTHIFIERSIQNHEQHGTNLPWTPKNTLHRPSSKGKARELHDVDFDAERSWLLSQKSSAQETESPVPETSQFEDDDEAEGGIECGCCFTEYPFRKMIQCPEAHLFCTDCMTTYASTLLGSHDHKIKCMDQSGCTADIPASELRRSLPRKLLDLWERVKQRKELEAAEIQGLEECPFCDWSCIIDNPDEKLFRCENVDICGEVSCRKCKKPVGIAVLSILPTFPSSPSRIIYPGAAKVFRDSLGSIPCLTRFQSLEVEDEKHLDGQHAVEEAMTRALMRNCPKCKKPFVKDGGCNVMTCPNCRAISCYICRKLISGHGHFNQVAGRACGSAYDQEQLHADEVKQAADAALEQYKRDHADFDETKIKIDVPVPRPNPLTNPVVNLALLAHGRALHQVQQLLQEENRYLQEVLRAGEQRALMVPPGEDIAGGATEAWYLARQRTQFARDREREAREHLDGVQGPRYPMDVVPYPDFPWGQLQPPPVPLAPPVIRRTAGRKRTRSRRK